MPIKNSRSKLEKWLQKKFLLAASIGCLFFALYLSTMPVTNVGYADSDELITVGYHAGAAHPPGYPLYGLITYLFTHAPFPAPSIAFKAHLVSVVLSSLSLSLVFLIAWRLSDGLKRSRKEYVLVSPVVERAVTSACITAMLGISSMFWLYGQIAEKYSLSVVLIALVAYSSIEWLMAKPTDSHKQTWLLATIGFTGLAISHHQSLVILLPALIGIGWFDRQKIVSLKPIEWGKLALVGIVSLVTPFLLLIWMQSRKPLVSWYFDPSIEGVKGMILRYDFGGEIYQQGIKAEALLAGINLTDSLTALIQYGSNTGTYWGWWLAPLFFLGIRFGYKHHKKGFVVAASLFACLGVLLVGYLKWPTDNGSQAIIERQYLGSYIPLAILLWFGVIEYIRRFGKAGVVLYSKKWVDTALVATLLLPIFLPILWRYPELNLRNFTQINDQYRAILSEVEPNSIITCFSDVSCFALLYSQKVEGINKEATIVPLAYPLVKPELAHKNLQQFSYTTNPYLLLDIVTNALDKRPVYAVNITDYFVNFLGLENGFMYYIPRGTYGQLSREIPLEMPPVSPTDQIEKWKNTQVPEWDRMRQFLKDNFAGGFFLNGYMYARMGLRPQAMNELNNALDIYYTMSPFFRNRGLSVRNSVEQNIFLPSFAPGSKVPAAASLIAEAEKMLTLNRNRQAFTLVHGALLIEPTNLSARLMLADMYEKIGDAEFATEEYRHVLLLDPENQLAKEKVGL